MLTIIMPTASEWREKAEQCRKSAAHWRMLIKQAEREAAEFGTGYAALPSWPETKAVLLEQAARFEADAVEAEARAVR